MDKNALESTGSGGGGAGYSPSTKSGGAGGSGIVLIAYPPDKYLKKHKLMSKLQVDDIVNKGDDGSVGFSRGAVVTGVATATSFSGALTGNVTWCFNVQGDLTGDVVGNVGGNVTGNMTGNINASSATGISTVGVLTAYSSIHINVGGGSTEIATELSNKTSPGKAIALSMVFG